MTGSNKTISRIVATVALVGLGFATLAFGHGAALEKKSGESGAAQEAGPHGGAVIDIGDGHFELVREADDSLSLYRLDDELKVIPAEDVDAAEIHASAGQQLVTLAMTKAGGDPSTPLHFSVASSQLRSLKAYMAVISVSMGGASQNLRFLVKNG